jgi:hypothetical protein
MRAFAVLVMAAVLDATIRDFRLGYVVASVPETLREAMDSPLFPPVRHVLAKSPA